MIAICGRFAVLIGLLMVPVEIMGSCVQSRGLGARTLPFEVYADGSLQWQITCGSNFRHSL